MDESVAYHGWRFDVLKFILAIMVVMIHTYPLPELLSPLLSIAVPIFFMLSSYFFWLKYDGKTIYLLKFEKRIFLLYLFWCAVLLPATIFINWRLPAGVSFSDGLLLFFREFLISGFFQSSWFLVALAEGMAIIFLLVKSLRCNNFFLVLFSLLPLAICFVEYSPDVWPEVANEISKFHNVIPSFNNSFLSSIFWIVAGKSFAESKNIKNNKLRRYIPYLIIISTLLLLLESQYLISDGFIATIALSICVFNYVLCIDEKRFIDFRLLRRLSIIIYCSHKTVDILLNTASRLIYGANLNCWILFIMTLLICSCLGILLIKLSTKDKFRVLKYAY